MENGEPEKDKRLQQVHKRVDLYCLWYLESRAIHFDDGQSGWEMGLEEMVAAWNCKITLLEAEKVTFESTPSRLNMLQIVIWSTIMASFYHPLLRHA